MFVEYCPSVWLCCTSAKSSLPCHVQNIYYSWAPEIFHMKNTELNGNSAKNKAYEAEIIK